MNAIDTAMKTARGTIPAYLGHAPRSIDLYHKSFKAAEWKSFLTLTGPPLLDQNLDSKCVENFRQLSKLYSMATATSLTEPEVQEIGTLAKKFVTGFEELYVRDEDIRLSLCTINVHSLLHIEDHIRDLGPAKYFTQFPMENYCGNVKPEARSKSQLSTSLSNEILSIEYLNALLYHQRREDNTQGDRPLLLRPLLSCNTTIAGSNSLKLPLLRHLTGCHDLTHAEVKVYKQYRVRPGLVIGSTIQSRSNDLYRDSFRIVYLHQNNAAAIRFAEVKLFALIGRSGQFGPWALVKLLGDPWPRIDHRKRVAYYTRATEEVWIEAHWIQSLLGLITERTKHGLYVHCVTDYDLFSKR